MKKLLYIVLNREISLYLVFGIGTTVVNFFSFAIVQGVLGQKNYLISNIIAFILATGFAFVTNKQWVFESKEWKINVVLKEIISFLSARISTFLVIEELGLWISVDFLNVEKLNICNINGILCSKIFLAFMAVLANYILGKYCVFKQRRKNEKGIIGHSSVQ